MVDQDTDFINCILADQSRLEGERAIYDPTFRDIDRFIDPFGSGGFLQDSGSHREIEDLFDITALEGLDRYTAAIAGLTIPQGQRWHGLEFGDPDLDKLPEVQRWSEYATDRLFACRYAPHTGFVVQFHEDIRQEGKYGTAPMWIGENLGRGLYYKALHLSEIWIDENFAGQVDRKHRKFIYTLRQAVQQFGIDNLSDRLRADYEDPRKHNDQVQFLHLICPNTDYREGWLDHRGKPIASITLEIDEKHIVRRKGFRTDPLPVSRHITGPRDKYGRSPGMKVLATVKGLQVMARDILDAGNRALKPPLLFFDDADITELVTKPDGLNPGGLDEFGREMVKPLLSGQQIPFGMELSENERGIVRKSFLEEFFRLLSNPSDRMTATQVLETLQKEGILVAPYAGRRETEKVGPMVERELDVLMDAQQIPPFPDVVKEAGRKPRPIMTNPLSRMARAEEVRAFTRVVEIGSQAIAAGLEGALDRVKVDEGMVSVAQVLGMRPSLIRTDEEVAQVQEARAQEKAATMTAQTAAPMAGAALDMAKANEIAASMPAGL